MADPGFWSWGAQRSFDPRGGGPQGPPLSAGGYYQNAKAACKGACLTASRPRCRDQVMGLSVIADRGVLFRGVDHTLFGNDYNDNHDGGKMAPKGHFSSAARPKTQNFNVKKFCPFQLIPGSASDSTKQLRRCRFVHHRSMRSNVAQTSQNETKALLSCKSY